MAECPRRIVLAGQRVLRYGGINDHYKGRSTSASCHHSILEIPFDLGNNKSSHNFIFYANLHSLYGVVMLSHGEFVSYISKFSNLTLNISMKGST